MSLKKKLKKLGRKTQEAAKTVGRKAARVGTYAAPIVGALIAGPAGAGAGAALGAGLSQVHQKGDTSARKRKRLMTALKVGGGALAASGAIALATGAGIAQSPIQAIGNKLFGGADPSAPQQAQTPGGPFVSGPDVFSDQPPVKGPGGEVQKPSFFDSFLKAGTGVLQAGLPGSGPGAGVGAPGTGPGAGPIFADPNLRDFADAVGGQAGVPVMESGEEKEKGGKMAGLAALAAVALLALL